MSAPAKKAAAPKAETKGAAPAASGSKATELGSHLSRNYDASASKSPGFICGSCCTLNQIKGSDAIRCRQCGYRIMYKARARRPMEYLAR